MKIRNATELQLTETSLASASVVDQGQLAITLDRELVVKPTKSIPCIRKWPLTAEAGEGWSPSPSSRDVSRLACSMHDLALVA